MDAIKKKENDKCLWVNGEDETVANILQERSIASCIRKLLVGTTPTYVMYSMAQSAIAKNKNLYWKSSEDKGPAGFNCIPYRKVSFC